MKKILKKEFIFYEIISYIFSICLLLKYEINYNSNIPKNFIYKFHFNLNFFIKSFIISIPILLLLIFLLYLFNKIKIKNKFKLIENKKVFIISFIGLFITGLIFLIVYYPGNIFTDTLYIFKSPYGSSSQHPLTYIYFITIPFKVFNKLFKDINIAIFLTYIIQLLVSSTIISITITWINKTIKNTLITILLMIYFILTPIITNYNTSLIKDSLFCLLILLNIPVIYETIKSKGKYLNTNKNLIITIIIFTFTSLVRNNGIYIIILLLLILLVKYKTIRKKLLITMLIVLSLTTIQNKLSKKQLFQEKIAVPLQQITYTVYSNGKVSKKDIKYLNKIYKYNSYKENYNPYIVDSVKWDKDFNRDYLNKTENKFIKVWFNILPNNFEGYVKAYLLNTYGNWSTEEYHPIQGRFLGTNDTIIENPNLFTDIKTYNNSNKNIKSIYEKTTIYFGPGICFWILLLVISYIVYKKKYNLIIITIPLLAIWLSLMIATPFSLAFRYVSPFMYTLPIIISIVLKECNN